MLQVDIVSKITMIEYYQFFKTWNVAIYSIKCYSLYQLNIILK